MVNKIKVYDIKQMKIYYVYCIYNSRTRGSACTTWFGGVLVAQLGYYYLNCPNKVGMAANTSQKHYTCSKLCMLRFWQNETTANEYNK